MGHTLIKAGVMLAGLLTVLIESGCTFITSCPNNNGAPAGGGDNGGNGNAGAGGGPVLTGTWRNVTGNLAGLQSECGNLSGVFAKPDEDLVIAGVALFGLWASRDGSDTWVQMGMGADSDSILNRPQALVFDPSDTNRFWESGIYSGAGVFETRDDGDTFTALGDSQSNDLVSIDFTDAKRRTLVAGVHEQSKAVRRSTDGGSTWAEIGDSLPGGTDCTRPLVIDAQTYLVGCAGYGGGPTGIYRTTDGGSSWKSVSNGGGGAAPLRASDNFIYWSSPGNAGMVRSMDDGLTWTDADPRKATHTGTLAELPDTRIAAFGAKTIVVSSDHGDTWVPATTPFPYSDGDLVFGVTYSAQQGAFFIWHNTCGNFTGPVPVLDNAIMRYDFDYTVD